MCLSENEAIDYITLILICTAKHQSHLNIGPPVHIFPVFKEEILTLIHLYTQISNYNGFIKDIRQAAIDRDSIDFTHKGAVVKQCAEICLSLIDMLYVTDVRPPLKKDRDQEIALHLNAPYILIDKYDYSLEKKCITYEQEYKRCVRVIKELPSGGFIIGLSNGILKIYDTMCTLMNHRNSIIQILTLKDGHLVTASEDGTIRIWKDNKQERIIMVDVQCMAILPGKELIISGSGDGTMIIWNPDDGTRNAQTLDIDNIITNIVVVPFNNEYRIIAGFESGEVKVLNQDLDVKSVLEIQSEIQDYLDGVNIILPFSKDRIVTYLANDSLVIWNWNTEELLFILQHSRAYNKQDNERGKLICIIMYDEWIVTGSQNGIIKVWDPDTGTLKMKYDVFYCVNKLCIAPNNTIIAGLDNGYIACIDKQNILYVRHYTEDVSALLVTSQGKLIIGYIDGTLQSI